MGVAWVTGQMYDAAVRNSEQPSSQEERNRTVLAGLLHDLGHGPFSHLLEEILSKNKLNHERFTIRLLTETDSEVRQALDNYSSDLFSALVPFIDKRLETKLSGITIWFQVNWTETGASRI